MKTLEEIMMDAINAEVKNVTKRIIEQTIQEATKKIDEEIRSLSEKVAIEIAKRFDIEGHESTIHVRYRLK